jgi:hypothetical protein
MNTIMPQSRSSFYSHKFKQSRFDNRCECRELRSYRLHQPWWWRLRHPRKKNRDA